MRPTSKKPRRRIPFVLLALALLAGCGEKPADGAAPPPAPETVDIKPALAPPTEGDIKAAPPRKGLVGVLPNDFPRDLPIYLPSSIIDFGKKDGRRFLLLQSPDPRDAALAWVRRAAAEAGYQVSGQGGRLELRKGDRRASLAVTGQSTAELRYEY